MHSWLTTAVKHLAACPNWTYGGSAITATEPTAFTALALLAHGELAHGKTLAAQKPLDWLSRHQAADGSLGVTENENTPGWPTALAVLAWKQADQLTGQQKYQASCERACNWLLGIEGTTPVQAAHVGHDTTIPGWPWVMGTHSWLEPTVFSLLALRACEKQDHPRSQAAQRLIVDRLLPHGGANYGNTVVLGQELLPHIQPSGIALLATAIHSPDPRVARTIDYLEKTLPNCQAPHSLSFGLLGLAAHDIWPQRAESWLARCFAQASHREADAYTLSLLCLAGLRMTHPLRTNYIKHELPSPS